MLVQGDTEAGSGPRPVTLAYALVVRKYKAQQSKGHCCYHLCASMATCRIFNFQPMSTASSPARRATNVTLEATLLAQAKMLKINISQASEEGVARAVAARQAELWLQANQEALQSSNPFVEQHGLPLAQFRNF